MIIGELPTPAVLVEQSRVERNLDRMQAAATGRGLRLRPHAKTHKSVALARMQVGRGAVGICCAKPGEAEVFADSGIEDIRLPYPVNPANAARVLALLDRTRLSFIVDDLEVARGWSRVMQEASRSVDVLVKVDVGLHRCGIDPEAAGAAGFIGRIADLPGLRLRGLLSHAGHGYSAASEAELEAVAASEARLLRDLAARCGRDGILLDEISVGATPTARFSLRQEGLTEIRPGNYIYYDRTQVGLGAASWSDCALTVLARVVSRPAAERVVLDCGSKTLTNDAARGFGDASGYGAVLRAIDADLPDETLVIERLSEEHAVVKALGDSALRPGDLVRVVPNHSCVVSNLVDAVWVVDGSDVIDQIEVSARGRIT